ncbi:MAG: DUF885 domain-containing protein [Oscillospiraceae bacterium]|nr:DUF885 domain-containing protein [Oscillospiraceae bacterium]
MVITINMKSNYSNKPIIITAICAIIAVIIGSVLIFAFGDMLFSEDSETGQDLDHRYDDGFDQTFEADEAEPTPEAVAEALRFDQFLDELFADWVTADALSMNFFIAYPELMGIERPEMTFGDVTSPDLADLEISRQGSMAETETFLSFDYYRLREDQRIIHAIMQRNVDLNEIMDSVDESIFFTGYIRPLSGIQIQLPILLAEFTFYTIDDIERYLNLLEDTIRYFDDIIAFERGRAARGFFMSYTNANSVIEHLESFLENREDNLLITVFNDRINAYEELTDTERESYIQRNQELVLTNVLVAYENLLSAMRELRGSAVHSSGIASMPGGENVALAMLRQRAGTDRTAEQLMQLYEEWIDRVLADIVSIVLRDPDIFSAVQDGVSIGVGDGTAESFMIVLKEMMAQDFPEIEPISHVILEVHESLQDHMSPAFYLMPAIDNFHNNIIYINPPQINDELFLFTVMAHEGYPGHMYQAVYFRQQNPHPIRTMLSNLGYIEGWATYVEMLSYSWAGIDQILADFMWNVRLYDLLVQSYIDLGVNLMGWDHSRVAEVMADFNVADAEIIYSIYSMVTGIPLFTIPYSLGFIEMHELLHYAQDRLQDDFVLLEFHRFILDIGPAPFSIISSHMETWLSRQQQ